MRIVVAIDGLDSAKTALRFIRRRKYDSDLFVHLVHAVVPGFADVAAQGIPDVVRKEESASENLLQRVADELRKRHQATVTFEIATGEADNAIANACKNFGADEVILPSHLRHGFSKFWFGSVAEEIAAIAPCTALVLKMPHPRSAPACHSQR